MSKMAHTEGNPLSFVRSGGSSLLTSQVVRVSPQSQALLQSDEGVLISSAQNEETTIGVEKTKSSSVPTPVSDAIRSAASTSIKIKKKRVTSRSTKKRTYVDHTYIDHAKSQILKSSSESDNKSSMPFPMKLYQILELAHMSTASEHLVKDVKKLTNGEGVTSFVPLTNAIEWCPHGRAFVIKDRTLLQERILGNFFLSSNYNSFNRQLNIYGFAHLAGKRDIGAYYSPYFLRSRPDLIQMIKRQCAKETGYKPISLPEDEPNFYSMEYMLNPYERSDEVDSTSTKISSYVDLKPIPYNSSQGEKIEVKSNDSVSTYIDYDEDNEDDIIYAKNDCCEGLKEIYSLLSEAGVKVVIEDTQSEDTVFLENITSVFDEDMHEENYLKTTSATEDTQSEDTVFLENITSVFDEDLHEENYLKTASAPTVLDQTETSRFHPSFINDTNHLSDIEQEHSGCVYSQKLKKRCSQKGNRNITYNYCGSSAPLKYSPANANDQMQKSKYMSHIVYSGVSTGKDGATQHLAASSSNASVSYVPQNLHYNHSLDHYLFSGSCAIMGDPNGNIPNQIQPKRTMSAPMLRQSIACFPSSSSAMHYYNPHHQLWQQINNNKVQMHYSMPCYASIPSSQQMNVKSNSNVDQM